MTTPVHPIEVESYRILRDLVDLSSLSAGARAVVERVIHATADLSYAQSLVVPDAAVDAAVKALAGGCPVVTDVEMTRAGISGIGTECHLGDAVPGVDDAPTRTASGIRCASRLHPSGALVVIGCAPSALVEVLALAEAGHWRPAAVIALPVGFVGAAAAKEAALASDLAVISNHGDKGGSAPAAAACNALVRLAHA